MSTITLKKLVSPCIPEQRESPTTDPLLPPLTPFTGQGYTWLPRWLMRDIGPDAVGGFVHDRSPRDYWGAALNLNLIA